MVIDPWYAKLADRYGEEFCRIAGYFDEELPWLGVPYGDMFDLPHDKMVFQFSGCFFPFHKGHIECIKNAMSGWTRNSGLHAVIHVDHQSYLKTKSETFQANESQTFDLLRESGLDFTVVYEDDMIMGCSRNFTRLYAELTELNDCVAFVCGGDRANFALTFMDEGMAIVSGRDQHPLYEKYKYLRSRGNNVFFVPGNNPISSTAMRNENN